MIVNQSPKNSLGSKNTKEIPKLYVEENMPLVFIYQNKIYSFYIFFSFLALNF